jgi:hypothetical protein
MIYWMNKGRKVSLAHFSGKYMDAGKGPVDDSITIIAGFHDG